MYYHPLKSPHGSGRHRSRYCGERSTELQNLILRFRRVRRVCRPYFAIVVRLLIVLFTVIELKPTISHFDDELLPFISRVNVLLGTMASVFSVIYFDVRAFNVIVILAIFIKFLFDMTEHERFSLFQQLAWITLHATAVLFSMFTGRRRSICKPTAFKSPIKGDSFLSCTLKHMQQVDVLEAGIRMQVAILAIDYSLSSHVGGTAFFFTLPFAVLYATGYSTRRNGAVTLLLLFVYALSSENSPILGFNWVKVVSTMAAAALTLSVGPGLLTVDEWLACSKQLCY
ncbi:unnamed protein product [Chondrus crispus]|uniref:Transmembrane protein n=1 Tax=Chondrus crispus TaxID=2769 RepID=R7QKE6_CHOCR|nr:unnamed protein product [Chondrus crispus]CDF37880.1 unnamed protein product [Chondrus crispus]|eukprot:XP_005717751.1 unnamed protein product [Chondrus crispus]